MAIMFWSRKSEGPKDFLFKVQNEIEPILGLAFRRSFRPNTTKNTHPKLKPMRVNISKTEKLRGSKLAWQRPGRVQWIKYMEW